MLKLTRTEGSSHFRPDAVLDAGDGEEAPKKAAQKRETPDGGEPKPPKKAKTTETGEEAPRPKPKPAKSKKEKKDDAAAEEGEESEDSSMPW